MTIRRCRDCLAEGVEPGSAKLNRPIVEGSSGLCAVHWRAEQARRKRAERRFRERTRKVKL